MDKSDDMNDQSRFYRVIPPSEIEIEREDIFYREKYNEIINYLKLILTNDNESIIEDYKNYIQPCGALLIQISAGSDISDYLKLISKNYYLDFIELDYDYIEENPENFLHQFNLIFNKVLENKAVDNDEGSQKITKIFLINQFEFSHKFLDENDLLKIFLRSHKNNFNLGDKGSILIWITHNNQEVEKNSHLIFNIFDLFIKIPILDNVERETILRNFSEKNPKIVFEINTLIEQTSNWEVKDIKQLLKLGIFKHFLRSELNDNSNEITDILINLIESGEFIPQNTNFKEPITQTKEFVSFNQQSNPRHEILIKDKTDFDNYRDQIQKESVSDFMLNQLYEDAASTNYTELMLIIDKLLKSEPLEANDRKLLAQYAFVLNDSPKMAQIYLEKAKKRVDQIKRAFGK